MSEVSHLPASDVTDVRVDDVTPPNPYPSGYGRKVPTRYMVQLGKRWHRVYMMQYGNSGSAYVIRKGQTLFLETETEYKLEDAREGVVRG